ncbi:guanine deaminase [Branchiibius hedensis]|uniref:Guanine deaminase n=1 Tax=Branchiibius hedensis TaxID=672460 RepID=A0A2Y8ZY61_9MICO|nr:guanine deaminase [Branchiibius hedensis]PWJ27408.1 guanine deaminase [Branchiibius hedensis]SSA36218.1 guanine deaminase [Branchiibius hedensis]
MSVIFRARVLDTPDDPFAGGSLRSGDDVGLLVDNGIITARGEFAAVRIDAPDAQVVDLRDGVLIPGLVDTHVHFPQVHVIGGLGMPLLDWLERCALPEEARLADRAYAEQIAREFLSGVLAAGTTSAMVFGAHFATAMDAFFGEAARVGMRATAGLVVSDRILRSDLLTSPTRAYEESRALIDTWHGRGRLRYAVTPRFALSASGPMLESCQQLVKDTPDLFVTSHVNENNREIAEVAALFPDSRDYVDCYDQYGLLGRRTILAHNVHPKPAELAALASASASVSHCPTSNASLGSGFFPLREHLDAGVRVALGSDVGGGTGFSLFKEGLQAYFVQQLLGDKGVQLTPAHLLYLATAAGAQALDLAETVGDLSVGKSFDAVLVQPATGSTLDVCLKNAADPSDALAKMFVLGTAYDVAKVWIGGDAVHSRD